MHHQEVGVQRNPSAVLNGALFSAFRWELVAVVRRRKRNKAVSVIPLECRLGSK